MSGRHLDVLGAATRPALRSIRVRWEGGWSQLGVLATVFAMIPAAISAQAVVQIDDDIRCNACEIELHPLTTLRPPVRAGFTSLPPPSVARDIHGYYATGVVLGDSAMAIYTSDGRLSQLVGRRGQGPHEFVGYPHEMVIRAGPGEFLAVFHGGMRYLVQASTGDISRQDRVAVHVNDAVVVGDTAIVQAAIYAANATGTPLQILANDGVVLSGMGSNRERPLTASSPFFEHYRRLARANDRRSIWSAYINRYEMSRFSLDGREELRVQRDHGWFRPYTDVLPTELLITPQRPRLEGLVQDSTGLLWIVISHGAENMEPIAGERALSSGSELAVRNDLDLNLFLSTTIEVVDVGARAVLARRTVENAALRFVSDAQNGVLLYVLRQAESGELTIEVFAASMKGRSSAY